MFFNDRRDAGQQLATRLAHWRGHAGVVVLGIPRGGVHVAAEVARGLAAPLDVFVTHKLGAPDNPELAFGAVAGDAMFLNEEVIDAYSISQSFIKAERDAQLSEIVRREAQHEGARRWVVSGQAVILVDDGIATGATVVGAGALAEEHHQPTPLILAVPVAPGETAQALSRGVRRGGHPHHALTICRALLPRLRPGHRRAGDHGACPPDLGQPSDR